MHMYSKVEYSYKQHKISDNGYDTVVIKRILTDIDNTTHALKNVFYLSKATQQQHVKL